MYVIGCVIESVFSQKIFFLLSTLYLLLTFFCEAFVSSTSTTEQRSYWVFSRAVVGNIIYSWSSRGKFWSIGKFSNYWSLFRISEISGFSGVFLGVMLIFDYCWLIFNTDSLTTTSLSFSTVFWIFSSTTFPVLWLLHNSLTAHQIPTTPATPNIPTCK